MPTRRLALVAPFALAACRTAPTSPPPVRRLEGYAYLTPLRLNVAEVEVVEAPPGPLIRADAPAPLDPAAEVARMGRDRLSAFGTTGRARFTVGAATLVRVGGRLAILLRAGVEIIVDDRRVAFAEAESRRDAPDPGGPRRAEAEMVRAMEELNVEFEVQVRRNLHDWLVAGALPPSPAAPDAPGTAREDLPRG